MDDKGKNDKEQGKKDNQEKKKKGTSLNIDVDTDLKEQVKSCKGLMDAIEKKDLIPGTSTRTGTTTSPGPSTAARAPGSPEPEFILGLDTTLKLKEEKPVKTPSGMDGQVSDDAMDVDGGNFFPETRAPAQKRPHSRSSADENEPKMKKMATSVPVPGTSTSTSTQTPTSAKKVYGRDHVNNGTSPSPPGTSRAQLVSFIKAPAPVPTPAPIIIKNKTIFFKSAAQAGINPNYITVDLKRLKPKETKPRTPKRFVPDSEKTPEYFAKRARNTELARRCRDERRIRENELFLVTAYLEEKYKQLQAEKQRLLDLLVKVLAAKNKKKG